MVLKKSSLEKNIYLDTIYAIYLDAPLAARPHDNGAAILVRATLHKSHIGTEENIPNSAAVWGPTDRRTLIKTDLGELCFTGKCEQLFLDVFWSFLTLFWL